MQDDLLGNIGSMPKVDPRNYETVKCSHCGSIQFVQQVVMKRVSGMELGQGATPTIVPLPIMVCAKCGEIWDEDIRGYKLDNDIKTEEKTNILI